MRWEAIFQDIKKEKKTQQTYGLRSFKILLPARELAAFESKLIKLVKSINLWKVKNQQQNQLKEDIKKTNQPNKTLTFADKSSNMYRLTKEHQHMKKQTETSRNELTLKKNKLWKMHTRKIRPNGH